MMFRFGLSSSPIGITNLGNTCFVNAILQCISYCNLLHDSVRTSNHQKLCSLGECTICKIEKCVHSLRGDFGPSYEPSSDVIKGLIAGCSLPFGRQEDAHEFLFGLMLSMKGSKVNSNIKLDCLFSGSLCSRIHCESCGTTNTITESVLDLQLDIAKSATLESALLDYCKIEKLTNGNEYCCSHCSRKSTAMKCLRIEKSPPILVIQLKRFQLNSRSEWDKQSFPQLFTKSTKFVEYPEILDLAPYIFPESGDNHLYELMSMVIHNGATITSGHYVSVFKSQNRWYQADDSVVTPISEERALTQCPYMLFYERCAQMPNSHPSASSPEIPQNLRPLYNQYRNCDSGSTSGILSLGKVLSDKEQLRSWDALSVDRRGLDNASGKVASCSSDLQNVSLDTAQSANSQEVGTRRKREQSDRPPSQQQPWKMIALRIGYQLICQCSQIIIDLSPAVRKFGALWSPIVSKLIFAPESEEDSPSRRATKKPRRSSGDWLDDTMCFAFSSDDS